MGFVPGTGCGGTLLRTALGGGDDGGAEEDSDMEVEAVSTAAGAALLPGFACRTGCCRYCLLQGRELGARSAGPALRLPAVDPAEILL